MHNEEVVTTVVGIIGLLLIAAAAAIGLKRARLPYTVGLVLVGLVLGGIAPRFAALEPLHQLKLSPELILFVFLPTLIFESAFNLDSRLLARNLAPVLALAAPGLLLSTAIVGGMMAWLTPLDLGPALVFGALISATDPVAVIALFKEVGAPKRLAILVEGESLFNDATAIVLFGIILGVVTGGGFSAAVVGNGILEFLFVFIGGLVVGAAIGYVMIRSIALARDEPLVEVALSTVVAYAAFIAADHYLHVSGVMATVGAGVVVGTMGSTRFTPDLRSYLHQFWEYAAFVANSLIFLMVGISVSMAAVIDHIGPIGWAVLIVLIARALTVFGLIPLVSRLPNAEPIDLRMRTVMFWGGLRGAVALALVLSLPESFAPREFLISLSVGIVLFTLLSGGLTMAPLIKALGLNAPTVLERVASAQAHLAAKRSALDRLGDLMSGGHFSNRLLGEVETQAQEEVAAAEQDVTHVRQECTQDDMRMVLWSEALTTERATYRNLLDHGAISEPVYRELELSTELRRDLVKRGEFPETLHTTTPLEVRFTERFMRLVSKLAPRAPMVQRHRIRALAARYELNSAVVQASARVVADIGNLGALSGASSDLVEACRTAHREIGATAMAHIDDIAEHFPEYVQAVQQQTARRMALDGESDAIEHLATGGGIPDSVARSALHAIRDAERALAHQPVAELAPNPEELLARVPFFQDLSADHFSRVAGVLIPRTVVPGEDIIKQGDKGRSLFLISRGVVAVLMSQRGDPATRVASLHAGDFFGEMALLSDAPRNATVQAVTGCQLYELFKKDVDALCESFPGIRKALVSTYESRSSATITPVKRASGHFEV